MKKNYIVLLLSILFTGMAIAQESQKNFINYQGVARNADNALMSSEEMTINIALKFGNASATSVYEESHAISTDANGVFSLLIGNGSSTSGNYNTLPWGSAATFVTVSINGKIIGTTEMMAVPYALSAGNIKDPLADEVLYDNSTSGLTATTTQDAIDELVTGGSVDADSDPSNEFQTLNFDAVTNKLSLSDGNSVTIPSGGTDADADPTNEIQTISFDATSNKISLTDGGEITIPSGGTDADADPENELQTLAFDAGTNELSLSDGNTIVIPTGGVDGDGDSTNEIQDISLAGTELTISAGSTIDLAPIVSPGGTDNQNLTFNETTKMLEIEDGNTIDLSSLSGGSGSSLWAEDEDGISRQSGVVGIGHQASLTARLFVQNSIEGIRNGISASVFNPGYKVGISSSARSNDDELTYGMRSSVESSAGATSYAYRADMNGAGTGTKYAFFSRIHAGAGDKYGIYTDGEDKNYLSGSLGIGIENPTVELDINGSIRSRNLTGSGLRNVMANSNGNLVIGAGGGSSLWGQNGDKIHYDTGNVGIGIDNPGAKLHLLHDSNIGSPQLRLEESESDYSRLEFKNQDMGFWHIAARGGATGDVRRLNFYFADGVAAGRDLMTVSGHGRVGIGNATPDEDLVVGSNLGSGWSIPAATVGNSTGGALEVGNPTINFSASAGTTFNRTRLIASDGNGPGQGLIEMRTRQLNLGRAPGVNTTRTYPLRVVQNVEGQGGKYGINLINGDDESSNWELFVTDAGQLSLYQNSQFRGSFDQTSGNYSPTSDARLKMNIGPSAAVLPKLLKLQPKRYNYKTSKTRMFNGFLAQELQKVFPEVVNSMKGRTGEASTLTVDYSQLISLTISAVQEQQQIIGQQIEKISELEERLIKWEAKIDE